MTYEQKLCMKSTTYIKESNLIQTNASVVLKNWSQGHFCNNFRALNQVQSGSLTPQKKKKIYIVSTSWVGVLPLCNLGGRHTVLCNFYCTSYFFPPLTNDLPTRLLKIAYYNCCNEIAIDWLGILYVSFSISYRSIFKMLHLKKYCVILSIYINFCQIKKSDFEKWIPCSFIYCVMLEKGSIFQNWQHKKKWWMQTVRQSRT